MIKEIQNKIHTQIPMTKLMQVELKTLDDIKLITTAPLNININDKGTAFGGSLNTLTIISSWCMAYYISKKFNINDSSIVISKNETKFLRPVTKDIICNTFVPQKDELSQLKLSLDKKSRGSIIINAQIVEDEKVCVNFKGTYIIKKV